MHNTYVSSTVLSLGGNGSLSFGFNDRCFLLNERFEKNPISCSPCCVCCAFDTHRVPINPSFLSGLRQSTLLQWSASRRLMLGGGGGFRYRYRAPVYYLNRGCYEASCECKERICKGRSEKRGRGRRIRCMVSEENSERYRLDCVSEAEAVISLLSEEMGEERNGNLSKRMEREKRGDYGSVSNKGRKKIGGSENKLKCELGSVTIESREEGYRQNEEKEVEVMISLLSKEMGGECFGHKERDGNLFKRVERERRGDCGSVSNKGRKKIVGSDFSKSKPKCELESVTIESREEGSRRNEEKEAFSRGGNRKVRKGGSSCSSYYSFSSSGDFESDTEVQVSHGGIVEESSCGYRKDSKRYGEGRYGGEVVQEFKRHTDDEEEHVVSGQRSSAVGTGVEWDWRKKSEKQLTEVSIEEKESSKTHSRISKTSEGDYRKTFGTRKQFNDEEEKSTSVVNLDKGMRKQYSQIGNQVDGQSESKRKYQGLTETLQLRGNDVETTSRSQKGFTDREENLKVAEGLVQQTIDERHKMVGRIARKDELRRISQQLTGTVEIQDVETERVSNSQRQSESIIKSQEENTLVQSTVDETKERHHQTNEQIIGQVESRRTSQQITEIPEIYGTKTEKLSLQAEKRMKNQEESKRLVSSSRAEEEQSSQTNRKTIQRIQSRKGYQDVTNISVVHGGSLDTVTNSERNSEKRMIDQKRASTSGVKLHEQTRHDQTEESFRQSKSEKEAQRTTKLSSSSKNVSEGQSSSQAILMPSPSQLVARGSPQVDSTSGIASQEASRGTSESDSSAFYTQSGGRTPAFQDELHSGAQRGQTYGESLNLISHEDSLGSANRLEKFSSQFVGEFVEKVTHEVSTSEIQKEKKVSNTKMVHEGEKHRQKSSSQYGSEDFPLKEHDSRSSSGVSGTKGPSDEMWDVTDPPVQETPKAEAPEATVNTGNAIARRTGKSFWGIIGDIIRLRLGSRAETPNSAGRSGGKSSSNESVSSEAWFSGRDLDENNDENIKRERRSVPQEATSSGQQQLEKPSTQNEGEASNTIRSKDRVKHLEADTSASSSVLESGLATKGVSSASGEENFGWNEDGKSFQGTPSVMEIVESSLPLPASGIRSAVEEITDAGKNDVSGSGSMEQPVGAKLIEVSGTEGKDGELKRRKLQRNKQVLKDRFDEWEEAYQLESEQRKIDEMFMREALLEAKKAGDTWEVPVGAVLVQHGKIIARGCNLVEELRDSTAHAEMICIREASNVLRTWRLADTTLYVTLEPCPMCAGAILQARINTLVWGAPNKLLGADGSWIRLLPNGGEGGNGSGLTDKPAPPIHPFHPKMTIRRGVMASECADIMQQFFQLRRKKKEKTLDPPTPPPSYLPISSHHHSKILTKMHDIFHVMFCL